MKQARRWLLLAAALTLLPQAAYAQKKKGTKGTTAPTPAPAAAPANADADADAPATPAPAGGAAGGAAGAAGGAAGGDTGAAGGATPAEGAGAGGGEMDVCQITPDAPQCAAAKEFNLAAEAKKQVKNLEIYAVQQQFVIKSGRFEIMPYFAITMNDQFVGHNAPGLALNYYITQVLAVGANGNWYQGLNSPSDFNFQARRSALVSIPLTEYQFSVDGNFTYVPMYGKFAGFGDFIFHYDAFVEGGVGVLRTRPIPIIDPDNRKFDWQSYVNFDVGIGFRIFFNRWLAAVLEVRDLMFFEKIENTLVATGQAATDPKTWYDKDTHFTNDVQLQVGLSMFLPTSFDYKLPK
jgi:outer membrane beta-barrel protein